MHNNHIKYSFYIKKKNTRWKHLNTILSKHIYICTLVCYSIGFVHVFVRFVKFFPVFSTAHYFGFEYYCNFKSDNRVYIYMKIQMQFSEIFMYKKKCLFNDSSVSRVLAGTANEPCRVKSTESLWPARCLHPTGSK